MGRWTTRSFPTLLQEMTKLKEKEDRTKEFFLPSVKQGQRKTKREAEGKNVENNSKKNKSKSGLYGWEIRPRHRFASYLDSEDALPKLGAQQSTVVEQADDMTQSLTTIPDQQGFDFNHDINPGNYDKYFGEGEKFNGGVEVPKEGGRQDRRRKQVAAEISEQNAHPLNAAANDVANVQYSARRAIAGISPALVEDPEESEAPQSQAAVEWVGGILVPTSLWRQQVSDRIASMSPELDDPEETPRPRVIPQEILDLLPDNVAKDSELMQEMIEVLVKNSPRSTAEAARSGKVPMEILEYEELFRKMTHSARLLFHLGGGRNSLPMDHKKFRCHSIVAAEARNREQQESERQARQAQERASAQQYIRRQTQLRGEEAAKRELKLKIDREMEYMPVKCFCARRETAREDFRSPRRIAGRVRRDAAERERSQLSPAASSPGLGIRERKKAGPGLLERRRKESGSASPQPELSLDLGGSTR